MANSKRPRKVQTKTKGQKIKEAQAQREKERAEREEKRIEKVRARGIALRDEERAYQESFIGKRSAKVHENSTYTEELADLICELVATHPLGLDKICAMYEELPDSLTIYRWRRRHPDFGRKYILAKAEQANILAESTLDIADDASGDIKITRDGLKQDQEFVNRSRLRIDTRKWLAEKLQPRIWGSKELKEEYNEARKSLEEKIKEAKEFERDR